MKIPVDKLQTIDANKYKSLSKKIYDTINDDFYKSLWDFNKLVSKEEYDHFIELILSLSGPQYLPVYISVFEELICCFTELVLTGLLIDDYDLQLNIKLLKLFNKVAKENLILITEVDKNPFNKKFSKYPFFSALYQPYHQSVPDVVCRNLRLLTALFISSQVQITENWSARLRKVKGAIYQYKSDEIFISLSLNVDSLSAVENLCFIFDKPLTYFEGYSTYSFEKLQKHLFNNYLTSEQQDHLKPKCPLLFDADKISSRKNSDARNAFYNKCYFKEFKNSQSTKKSKVSKKPIELATNVLPEDIQQVEIQEDKTKKSKYRKYTKNIKPSISSRNFTPNITGKNKEAEVDESIVTVDSIEDAVIIDDSYKSADNNSK